MAGEADVWLTLDACEAGSGCQLHGEEYGD